jgi:DNA ligase (NAD+)
MDKKEIQKLYQKKIKLLNRYNQYYYDKNKPLVDDKIYDELKTNILLLEKRE